MDTTHFNRHILLTPIDILYFVLFYFSFFFSTNILSLTELFPTRSLKNVHGTSYFVFFIFLFCFSRKRPAYVSRECRVPGDPMPSRTHAPEAHAVAAARRRVAVAIGAPRTAGAGEPTAAAPHAAGAR